MLQVLPQPIDAPPPYTRALLNSPSPSSSAASSLFSTSSDPEDGCIYRYPSKAVSLSFNQVRHDGVRLPAYGREGIVSGEVYLRSTAHVESITLSLRGEIKTVIEGTCRPTLNSTTILLEQHNVLWSMYAQGDSSPLPNLVPFSLLFPATGKDEHTPLPPSFIGAISEAHVRVRYKVIVTVHRTGWHHSSSVETEIFYLPLPLEGNEFLPSLESSSEEPPVESPFDMKIIKLAARRITEGKSELSHVNAHFAYPSLVSLSHNRSITFNLWLSSLEHPIETLLALAPHISIRLVRTVSVTARSSTVTEESILSHQSLRASDMLNKTESHGQVLSFSGNIEIPKDMWRSWTVPRAARVSYSLKVSLPPNVEPEVAYIDHKVMIAFVSGSDLAIEHPEAPDLGAIPSPAASLKKHTPYMPMRV
ncbi:hypothetical protein RSOLAG22IIIB_12944 [Rhizoctonia solani]|uniref:Arrestin-like N-terminal domain-containing protein n=1 Tax=Rhizoctonia solani TaxID=456999 RepID=A0A0K6GHZ3_9AGAM|nr:hypothetical protein RSOLAG22IIIB_12944 [Rhizoctonia solani]